MYVSSGLGSRLVQGPVPCLCCSLLGRCMSTVGMSCGVHGGAAERPAHFGPELSSTAAGTVGVPLLQLLAAQHIAVLIWTVLCCAVLCCVSGGYGGMRGEVALDPKEECIQAARLSHVLCTAWRNDNSGRGRWGEGHS